MASSGFSSVRNTTSTGTEIKALADFLRDISKTDVLRHCLGISRIDGAPELLDRAIVNIVDCESYEWDHSKLTEIGLAAFDSQDMRATTPSSSYGEELLKKVYFYHFRLIPNSHLRNKKFCYGDPTANRFGSTRFGEFGEAKTATIDAFDWPIDETQPELGFCPVIFVGHSVNNDTRILSNSLGLGPDAFGTIVKSIDTQHLAKEAAIRSKGQWIRLQDLCEKHHFAFRDGHTACDDAAYTIISVVFTAAPELFDTDTAGSKSTQNIVDEIERHSQDQIPSTHGIATYCSRCSRSNHLQEHCKAKVYCKKGGDAGRTWQARSHSTQNCTWN